MTRLIDADQFGVISLQGKSEDFIEGVKYILEKIDEAPTVEQSHGEWIRNDNGTYSCSVCHSWIPEEQHYYARYCLHCGRTMSRGGDK